MRSLYRRHLGQTSRKASGIDPGGEANGELCCICFCLSVYESAAWAPAHTIAWRQHNERPTIPLPHSVLEATSVRMEREHGRMPMTASCGKKKTYCAAMLPTATRNPRVFSDGAYMLSASKGPSRATLRDRHGTCCAASSHFASIRSPAQRVAPIPGAGCTVACSGNAVALRRGWAYGLGVRRIQDHGLPLPDSASCRCDSGFPFMAWAEGSSHQASAQAHEKRRGKGQIANRRGHRCKKHMPPRDRISQGVPANGSMKRLEAQAHAQLLPGVPAHLRAQDAVHDAGDLPEEGRRHAS